MAVSAARTVADWQTAVDLYHGPLLPGWYEEWLAPERERLQQLFLQAGETLLHLLENQRRYPAAIQTAQHLLRHDPLHEPTYRCLMRLQALSGGKADALRTYHTCATLLEQELGVTPDEATHALYEQLLHAGFDLAPAPTTEPETAITPLVGRDEEWSQLKYAWQMAARGRTSMVLISGEAGTGKSRLAAELLQWAQRQGIAAATTRSYEAEGDRVVVDAALTGTHEGELMGIPPTGKQVEMPLIIIYRVSGGKIVDHTMVADQAGLMQQLSAS